jgi:hypothetical protein
MYELKPALRKDHSVVDPNLTYAKVTKCASVDQQTEVLQETAVRAKVMKVTGYTDDMICAALSLTAGGLNKALGRSASRAVERHMRKSAGKGLIGRIEGMPSPAMGLRKSSVDSDEPEVCYKARHMLALGDNIEDVCKELGTTKDFLRKWIGHHWHF